MIRVTDNVDEIGMVGMKQARLVEVVGQLQNVAGSIADCVS